MRGTPVSEPGFLGGRRFIPAYAGNTVASNVKDRRNSVHPRVCGEHSRGLTRVISRSGSSPRMRGTRISIRRSRRSSRFIPAYAGNTGCRRNSPPRCPVHPRVCGEHFLEPFVERCPDGSSPRMRGTHKSRVRLEAVARFIPAYAGNTDDVAGRGRILEVHPRVCGEHPGRNVVSHPCNGSSPRMRGTPRALVPDGGWTRFIPAYAGNTTITPAAHSQTSVHPRVCGEHLCEVESVPASAGSSPRMRGTRASRGEG